MRHRKESIRRGEAMRGDWHGVEQFGCAMAEICRDLRGAWHGDVRMVLAEFSNATAKHDYVKMSKGVAKHCPASAKS